MGSRRAHQDGAAGGYPVINYYSTAPDPELEQLRGLALEALGSISGDNCRSTSKTSDGRRRSAPHKGPWNARWPTFASGPFREPTSSALLLRSVSIVVDFEELDLRDVERMRGNGNQSFEARTYVLIEQRIQEILLQCGVDLGHFVNRGLLQKIGTLEQRLPKEELEEWLAPGENATLEPLEINVNLEDMSLLGGTDESAWPDEAIGNASGTAGTRSPELEAMQSMMKRILTLVESQDARISALKRGRSQPRALVIWPCPRGKTNGLNLLQIRPFGR